MSIGRMPSAEVAIDASLVRRLLAEQHGDLAELPLADAGEGWDNRLFRLGDELLVRLPRRAAAAGLILDEQRWLPILAAALPLPIPVPVRIGTSGCGFPWAWTIARWLPGRPAATDPPADVHGTATDLGTFVAALHRPAAADAPHNPFRTSLTARDDAVRERIRQLEDQIDAEAARRLWDEVMRTPRWTGPPLWLHGDLHPGNILVHAGRLSAVIDFGDLTAGDPAVDLSVAWMLLPPAAWPEFRRAAAASTHPIDSDTWQRACGWALALGLAYLVHSGDNPAMGAVGRRTIAAALGGASSRNRAGANGV